MSGVEKALEFEAHDVAITTAKFTKSNGRLLASASRDGTVKIWIVGETSPLMSLQPYKNEVTALSFDESEEHLIVGYVDGTVHVLDLVRQGQVVRSLDGVRSAPVSAIAFLSYPLPHIVALWRGMSIEVWDLLSHSRLRTFISRTTNESLPNSRSLLTFSPCSRWLIAASDSCPVLTVWTVASGELATTIEAETDDGFTALELNPSRLILSAGTLKGIFYQLQLDTKTRERPLQTMRGKISKIAYNSDGSLCLGVVSDGLYVLDAADKKQIGNALLAPWKSVGDAAVYEDADGKAQCVVFTKEKRALQLWIVDVPTLLLPQAKAQTEDELIDELLQTSYEHSAVLTTRLTQVKVAKSFIFKGKLKDALDHIAGLQDLAVSHDVLHNLLHEADVEQYRFFKPAELAAILSQLRLLLGSTQEAHVESALAALQQLVRAVGSKGGPAALQDPLAQLKRQCLALTSGSARVVLAAKDVAKQIMA